MTDIVLLPSDVLFGRQNQMFAKACARHSLSYHSVCGMMHDFLDHLQQHKVKAIVCDLGWLEALNNFVPEYPVLANIPVGVIGGDVDPEMTKRMCGPKLNIVEVYSISEVHRQDKAEEVVLSLAVHSALQDALFSSMGRSRIIRRPREHRPSV
ncbi:MAG: hypothetical protein PHY92_08080 [Alphaproteobacteria bacterium]|nr:hypothetical protein [Alphaproteobacteria bacterium]